MPDTLSSFTNITALCREIYLNKSKDYGTAWRILRPSSLTDQLYIKAMRIRSIEEKGQQKVSDPVEAEFVGLINYSILALVQLETGSEVPLELSLKEAVSLYDRQVDENLRLLQNKNHDYGEAWRQMRISSMTDLILQKLLRIKQIEDNSGATLVSEGVAANYRDIINYAVFCLIKMDEARQKDS